MKVYRVSYSDPDHGTLVTWVGNLDEVRREIARIEADPDNLALQDWGKVEIPTKRRDLIAFLNRWFPTDNG